MNSTSLFLRSFLLSLMLLPAWSLGQNNRVPYGKGTNTLGVVFADAMLPLTARNRIVSDLRLCLQDWGKKSDLRLRADGGYAGYLFNYDSCPCYPEKLSFPEDVIAEGASGFALQVPKTLSDAYTNAFAFVAANDSIVTAAYEFVSFVSSSNFMSIPSNAIPNYILYSNTNATSNWAGPIHGTPPA